MNESGKNGLSCLVPNLRYHTRNDFSFLLLNMMLMVSLWHGHYYVIVHSLLYLFDKCIFVFYHTWMVNFDKNFIYINWSDHIFFVLNLLMWMWYITLICRYWITSCIAGLKPYLIMMYNSNFIVQFDFIIFCWGFLHL